MVVLETVNRERAKSTITAGKSAILAVKTIISGPVVPLRNGKFVMSVDA